MAGEQILIVDDERVVSLDLQGILAQLDYQVAGIATSGKEAIEKTGDLRPDLVLMDIRLSGEMDGIEAAIQIARQYEIPVVFLTAYSDDETLTRAMKAGPFGYLLKPFEERELHTAIEIALYKHKMERELRDAKRAAESANEAKSSFLATVSHELRTPMNGVLGLTEVLLMTDIEGEAKEYAHLIKESAFSLLKVINQILDYSRIESNMLELHEGRFDLNNVFSRIVKRHKRAAMEKKLSLTSMIRLGVPVLLRGDSGRLEQVLDNLVDNGIKFTEKGGVTIEACPRVAGGQSEPTMENGRVRLLFKVTDTGVGIPQDKEDEIFGSFTQAEHYLTRRSEGLGLGLAAAGKLVALLGGRLWLERPENGGASFCFTADFGVLAEDETDVPPPTKRAGVKEVSVASELGVSGIRILVAEDDLVCRKFTVRSLEKAGFEPKAVEDGEQALKALQDDLFDLVLMDVQMPVMNGLEATQAIRSSAAETLDKDVPIVALTAHAMWGDEQRCLDAGMNGYLTKPVEAETVINVIKEILNSDSN